MMRKFKSLTILLFILVVILLATGYTYASGILNVNTKNFELPSKIHKDGEGFYEIGKMLTPRYRHSSVLLNDGRVFIVGGVDNDGRTLNTTEIFDPKTGTSIKGPDMPYPAFGCTLKLLSNGNVLIVGGQYNSENRVSVYLHKKNKIIEVKERLNSEIITNAIIENISDDEVFIADAFDVFGNYSVYNKTTNKLFNVKEQKNGIFINAYIGKINNNLYFLWGSNVITVNILNRNNFLNTYEKYKLDLKSYPGREPHAIVLENKQEIFIYTDKEDYIFFNVKTKKTYKPKTLLKLGYVYNIFLLDNENILFFSDYSKRSNKIFAVNLTNLSAYLKSYVTPNLSTEASVVKLNNNEVLYIGGATRDYLGFISNPSDKVYVWKTKKE